ncbi:ribonuclease III [Thermohalobacter berrensis]|uniref:Ribonuclease 3 n=1 Tax=Thermohalobacter berrensis TaxID=99594 RepID=A0A419TAB0_9FIRM|nr:ribonuclease III [Thermohalobacter berrensis]RKD34403.1 ribonuclease III [Thermohalobacter berrensis]
MGKLSTERKKQLIDLQNKIKYNFKDLNLIDRALTHSSYANENKDKNIKNNERLEFLGDSVLGLVVSNYIFEKYPNYPEGELSKLRALVVCEPSLANVAKKIELGKYLSLGKGEEATGGRERVSILADAFEALIGSIYLDGGFKNAKNFVLSNLSKLIEEAVKGKLFLDYKTQLQEEVQKDSNDKIKYNVIDEEGPDHRKTFYVEVRVGNNVLGEGKGKSKKEAEQCAAKAALFRMGVLDE